MPYKRFGKCVYKTKGKKRGKKMGCSKTTSKAKKYLKALYANTDDVVEEIKDYFNNKKDEEDLLNVKKPAPWDHLTNTIDDEDIDIDIKEDIKQ